jgi:hypothetical protein
MVDKDSKSLSIMNASIANSLGGCSLTGAKDCVIQDHLAQVYGSNSHNMIV